MCFIYLYENRTMKSIEVILRREEVMRESDGGSESKQVTL
jgi:hypothetical protein